MGALVPDVLDGQVSVKNRAARSDTGGPCPRPRSPTAVRAMSVDLDGTADQEGCGHRDSMGRVSREGSPFR